MKTIINILPVLLLSSCLITGCKKEAKLTPSEKPEDVYSGHTLPQGNHPYDADIRQLFDKYGTMFLYKYVYNDLFFNISSFDGGAYDTATNTTTRGGYFDVPADQAYIGAQLDTLKAIWLNYYPDSLLKKGLPQKVYLVDSFYFAYPGPGRPTDNYPDLLEAYLGGDYILATFGGARIQTISPEEKYTLKGALNSYFLAYAHARGAVKLSSDFTALTDYSAMTYSNYYSLGIIDYNNSTPEKDWDAYMMAIVSNSYAILTSPGNILDPAVDTKGVIRKKYDIMIAYFMSAFGVDLQAIGNAGS
jgi:hypothetical protein